MDGVGSYLAWFSAFWWSCRVWPRARGPCRPRVRRRGRPWLSRRRTRGLVSGDNTFSVFQPQYERCEQGWLDGRAAAAVEDKQQ